MVRRTPPKTSPSVRRRPSVNRLIRSALQRARRHDQVGDCASAPRRCDGNRAHPQRYAAHSSTAARLDAHQAATRSASHLGSRGMAWRGAPAACVRACARARVCVCVCSDVRLLAAAFLATGGADGQIRLWSTRTREMVQQIGLHHKPVRDSSAAQHGRAQHFTAHPLAPPPRYLMAKPYKHTVRKQTHRCRSRQRERANERTTLHSIRQSRRRSLGRCLARLGSGSWLADRLAGRLAGWAGTGVELFAVCFKVSAILCDHVKPNLLHSCSLDRTVRPHLVAPPHGGTHCDVPYHARTPQRTPLHTRSPPRVPAWLTAPGWVCMALV